MENKCRFVHSINGYTCTVTSAVIIGWNEPNAFFSPYLGEHLPGKKSKDVKILEFENFKIKYFPEGNDPFTNLNKLEISR